MKAGPYELTEKIGQGGMGSVWRALSPKGEVVAIKLIPRWSSGESKARFDRERRLLAMLGSGEGFVPLLDAGDGASGPYLVMPLVGGGTLRDKLEKGPLDMDEAIELGRTLALALGRAHTAGIVHRDLKPENVLYTDDGRPLVADLGLGKHFRTDTPGASQSVALSQAGSFKGTHGYMAPEQAGNAEKAGPAADVFALGVILYECIAGEGPFDGPTAIASLGRIHQRDQTPLTKVRPETPRWLSRAVDRALDPDPATRFADGTELARHLEAGTSGELPGEPGRPLAVPIGLAGGLVLVLAASAFFFLRRTPAPSVSASPSPSPTAHASPPRPRTPSPAGPPAWFLALPEAERPPLPLADELAFGKNPGEYVNKKDQSVLVFVPAGTFVMGSAENADQEPVHEVELSAYFLGKLEVATRQFAAFVEASHHVTEAERSGSGLVSDQSYLELVPRRGACWKTPAGDGKPGSLDLPVVLVTWNDARAYVEWAGLALPTEAQWERAAGWDAPAKRARRFSWGDDAPAKGSKRVANLADEALGQFRGDKMAIFEGYDDGYVTLAPVGSFPAGTSPVGALDMNGNASELCLDTFSTEFVAHSPRKDPCCLEESPKVVERGGNFADAPAIFRVSHRADMGRAVPEDRLGFRVARPLVPRER